MSFPDSVKLIQYLASAVIVASSNPCVGLSTTTKIPFFLLSKCTDERFSTPKITKLLP